MKVNLSGGRMRIGELAGRTGVSTRLLRYYEEQGLLTPSRDGNGYRTYAEDAVVRVRQIRRLLAAGLTTEVIASALLCARGEEAHLDLCPELAGVLHRELAAIDDRIGAAAAADDVGGVPVRRRDLDTLRGVGPARVLTGEFRLVCQA